MHDQAPKPPASTSAEENSPVRPCAPGGEPLPWIPESKLPPLPENSINSHVRKILLRSPMFPRFYADTVIASAPNSHEAKILAANYQKMIDRINMSNPKSCTHIKVTGIPCGSPPLRGEQFCYFHQHAHRGVRKPPQSRLHPIAIFEDEESIQASLMEVVNALMRNTIDMKRAELILRALHIAVKNARRVKFAASSANMIKEVPDYAPPNVGTAAPEVSDRSVVAAADAAKESEPDLPYSAIVPPYPSRATEAQIRREAKAQAERDRQAAIRAHLVRAAKGVCNGSSNQPAAAQTAQSNAEAASNHVGTAAPGRPSGPEVPGRGAVGAPVPIPSTKKPPASVKKPEAPKERKNAPRSLP